MTLTRHIAATGIVAAFLIPFCTVREVILFGAGSVLIDVDHYMLYICRTGHCNIGGMFRYFDKLPSVQPPVPYVGLCLFHTVEFFLLVGVLALYYPVFVYFLAGSLYHFILDLFDMIRRGRPFIRAYSLFEHLIRRRCAGYPYY